MERWTEDERKQVRRELRRRLRASRPPLGKAVREDVRAFIAGRFETGGQGRLAAPFHMLRLAWKSDAFLGTLLYRVGTWLEGASVPILPTLIHRICIAFFDMSIGEYVVLGEGVYVPHGYLVIGGRATIGRWCVLCPWVSIGLTPGTLEAPELGDGVFVGTGAKILAPSRSATGPSSVAVLWCSRMLRRTPLSPASRRASSGTGATAWRPGLRRPEPVDRAWA